MVLAERDVEADPDHRPPLLRASLNEDAGDFAAIEPHVIRPFDRRGAGAADDRVDGVGYRDAGREREQPRRVADDDQQSSARPAAPPTRAPADLAPPFARPP